MNVRFPYDESRDPPAPVLPVRVGAPGRAPEVLLAALVDTGADLSALPDAVARQLRLPPVDQITIRGVSGTLRRAVVYAAEIDTGWMRTLVEVVGLGDETLIGRDLLNRWNVTLRGPMGSMEIYDTRAT